MSETSLNAAYERLFAALHPHLQAIALRGSVRSFAKNSLILQEGEDGDSVYVLLEGRVKEFSAGQSGREITYNVVERGQYFAETCLDGGPRPASALALEPSVCAVVAREAIEEEFVREPAFAMELLSQIIRRSRAITTSARNMALVDVYGRVVMALEAEHGPARPDRPVTLHQVTHQQIASRVGASREMVSRLLKDLEKGGYIELGVKRITLRKKLPARW